jgi:hypothetical protein
LHFCDLDFGAEASTDLNQHQMQFQQLAQFRAALRHTRVPSFVFQNPMNLEPVRSNVGQGIQQMCTSVFAELSPRAAAAAPLLSWLMDPAPQDHLRHRHQVDIKGKLDSANCSAGIGCVQDLGATQSCKPKPG